MTLSFLTKMVIQLLEKKQREFVLRDWAIVDTTLNNTYNLDSITVFKDSVVAYTFQKWERIMFQRDGITKDNVLTTQSHKEVWKKRLHLWMNYSVEELGGEIFINGKKYQ